MTSAIFICNWSTGTYDILRVPEFRNKLVGVWERKHMIGCTYGAWCPLSHLPGLEKATIISFVINKQTVSPSQSVPQVYGSL
jgi:hypothetical protein